MCRAGGRVEYRFRSASTEDGRLKVVDADLLFDTGAYVESQMIVILLTSSYLDALYPVEATRYRGRLVHTNNLPYYFHHGGGLAQFQFAFGQHVNSLALDLGMDPVEFHLLNAVEKGHTTPARHALRELRAERVHPKDGRGRRLEEEAAAQDTIKGIGIGIGAMASGAKGLFKHDTSAAFIKVGDDGKATLFVGLPDMGQSSHTAMAIIAAEVLGIAPTDITVVSGDTDLGPARRRRVHAAWHFQYRQRGKKCVPGCAQADRETAAAELGVKPFQLHFSGGQITVKREPEQAMAFAKAVYNTLHSQEGRFVMGRGFYNSPIKSGSMAYSFGAQIAEVRLIRIPASSRWNA